MFSFLLSVVSASGDLLVLREVVECYIVAQLVTGFVISAVCYWCCCSKAVDWVRWCLTSDRSM